MGLVHFCGLLQNELKKLHLAARCGHMEPDDKHPKDSADSTQLDDPNQEQGCKGVSRVWGVGRKTASLKRFYNLLIGF